MSAGLSLVCWLCAVATNGWLLFRIASDTPAVLLLKRAGIVLVGAPVCLVAIILTMAAIGAHPSTGFGDRLLSIFFTIVVLVMLTFANVTFHGMVDGISAFHRRVNAANLHRFPISFLIRHGYGLKMFGTMMWFAGGALMLYGVWFDMHV